MDIAKSTSKLTVVKIVNSIIGFIGIVYFANKLGANQLGIFFLFQAIIGTLAVPADLGIRGATEKRISEGENPESVFTTAALFKTFPISIVVIGILLFRSHLNAYVGIKIAILLVIGVVLQEYANFMINVLNGELRVGATAVLRLLKQVIWVGASVVLVSIGLQARGLVIGLLCGLAAMVLVGVIRVSTSVGRPSKKSLRSLWNYAKFNLVARIQGKGNQWIDTLVIGFFLGTSLVGVYEVAWRVTTGLMIFTTSYATSIFPQVSSWDANNMTQQIESFIPTSVGIAALPIIPGFFGTLLLAPDILGVVFGPEFATASIVLVILVLGRFAETVLQVLGRVLAGTNNVNVGARISVIVLVINTIFNLMLVWQFGIAGAAIATSLSFAIGAVIAVHSLSKFISVYLPYANLGLMIVASAGMYLILWLITQFIQLNTVLAVLAVVGLGAVIYGVFIYSMPPIRTDIQNVVMGGRNSLRRQ